MGQCASSGKEKAKKEFPQLKAQLLVVMVEAAVLRARVKATQVSELESNLTYGTYKRKEKQATEKAKRQGQAFALPFKHATKTCSYLLKSAPEFALVDGGRPVLAVMKALIEELGGQNLAGYAKDTFHQEIMPEAELSVERKGLRTAWLGKVATGLTMERKHCPKHRIFVVTHKGGPETDWEQQQIRQKILPSLRDKNVEELHFKDLDALLDYVYTNACGCSPASDVEALERQPVGTNQHASSSYAGQDTSDVMEGAGVLGQLDTSLASWSPWPGPSG